MNTDGRRQINKYRISRTKPQRKIKENVRILHKGQEEIQSLKWDTLTHTRVHIRDRQLLGNRNIQRNVV